MIPTASLPFSTPAPKLGRLLIVDDEVELMTALREMLTRQGYEAVGFTSGEQALEALREGEFDLLLTDLMMPGLDGIALLRAGLDIDPHLVGIIMTGQGTVQTAVEAMKTGAFDYVLKPFKLSAVLPILSRALDVRRLRLENVQLRETVAIYELSQAIAFTLDLNTILNKAADAALQQCEADEASIMLPTPEGKELYVAAVRGEQRAHLLGARVPFEQSIAGWVARQREPVNLQGEVRDARFAPIYPRPDIHSAISIPMLAGNQLVGVLNVNATRRRRRFTLGQVKALSILVSTAAAALENAWLHAQVQEAEERFRRLAENARDLIYRYRFIPTRGFEYVSPAATAITGYTPEEHYADPELGFKLVHPDDRPLLEAANRGETLSGAPLTLRWVRKDGSLVWTEQQNVPIYDEAGRLVAVEGIARDITERKRASEEINRLAKF
ncbi:MAG: hypothetical protein HW378_3872, partial [Anaerolineales bacterium]|nr:hypothetical protein [Anaerolineales bacterium]